MSGKPQLKMTPGVFRGPDPTAVGWFKMSNTFARDGKLPQRARSVGLYVLSHQAGFVMRQGTIAKHLHMSETTVRAALEDLTTAGYMRSWTTRDEAGRVSGTYYVIYDVPPSAKEWEQVVRQLTSDFAVRDDEASALTPDSEVRDTEGADLTSDSVARESVARESDALKGYQQPQEDQDQQGTTSSATPPSAEPPAEPPAQPPRADVEQLCTRLRDRMVENGCKPPTITKGWRDAARLLLDKDGRDLTKALNLLDWVAGNEFWRANIQSMPKFRAQYDQLRLRALTEHEQKQRRNSPAQSRTGAAAEATGNAFAEYRARLAAEQAALPVGVSA